MAGFCLLLLNAWLTLANVPSSSERTLAALPVSCLTSITDRTPEPLGDGLRADYYNGTNFEQKVLSRIEKRVDYVWANQHWAPGLDELHFSARWIGKLFAPKTGTYMLVARVDDGIRLWLGGKLLLDEWHGQSVIVYKRKVLMKAGRFYDLKIEYFNFYGPGAMQLSWEVPNEAVDSIAPPSRQPLELISQKYLYSPSARLTVRLPAVASPSAQTRRSSEKPLTRQVSHETSVAIQPARHSPIPPPVNKPKTVNKPASADPDSVPPNKPVEPFGKLEAGKPVTLSHVWFEKSRYLLLEDSYRELDQLVQTLLRHPTLRIEIAGHTDDQGDPRLNQALSENRATVVATYLIRHGVAADRIEAKGYGSTRPLAPNTTETERAQNRRVEFVVR